MTFYNERESLTGRCPAVRVFVRVIYHVKRMGRHIGLAYVSRALSVFSRPFVVNGRCWFGAK